MGHFIAFVLDLCCTAPNCNKETFIEIKKQIDEYLDNIIKIVSENGKRSFVCISSVRQTQ